MKFNNFEDLVNSINPEIHANMKQAIELGKWANGQKLSAEQKSQCMEAVLLWEMKNLPEEQRTGYMETRCKSSDARAEEQALNLVQP